MTLLFSHGNAEDIGMAVAHFRELATVLGIAAGLRHVHAKHAVDRDLEPQHVLRGLFHRILVETSLA